MRRILPSAFLLSLAIFSSASAATLSDEQRAIIEHECAKLSSIYATGIDTPDADLFASAFAKNATWITGQGNRSGRQAISDYVKKRTVSHGKHVITNILVEVIDENHARGTAYLAAYHYDTVHPENITSLAPGLVGKFTDEYVREDGKWFFQSRKLDRVNIRAAATPSH